MSRAHSSYIPADQVTEVRGWEFDLVTSTEVVQPRQLKAEQQAQEQAQAQAQELLRLESSRQSAQQEGYTQGYTAAYSVGYEEGFAAGQAQASAEGERQLQTYRETQGKESADALLQVVDAARTQLQAAEHAIAKAVLEMACGLAKQVLRQELRQPVERLERVVHEALGLLMADSQTALIRLNPQDLEAFAQQFEPQLQQAFGHLSISLAADAQLSRGGCLVESAGTTVDASVERRWQRALARIGMDGAWGQPDAPAA
jgi:flagellar assembly protein FliH